MPKTSTTMAEILSDRNEYEIDSTIGDTMKNWIFDSSVYLMQYVNKVCVRFRSTFGVGIWGSFHLGLILIPPWISKYVYHNVWEEITYIFPSFNGGTVEMNGYAM